MNGSGKTPKTPENQGKPAVERCGKFCGIVETCCEEYSKMYNFVEIYENSLYKWSKSHVELVELLKTQFKNCLKVKLPILARKGKKNA